MPDRQTLKSLRAECDAPIEQLKQIADKIADTGDRYNAGRLRIIIESLEQWQAKQFD